MDKRFHGLTVLVIKKETQQLLDFFPYFLDRINSNQFNRLGNSHFRMMDKIRIVTIAESRIYISVCVSITPSPTINAPRTAHMA